MHILLTNDDSHRSPLFRLTIELLQHFGDVSIVVPHHEQSWTSKSMSRFGSITAHSIELFGNSAHAVTGTPADCVSLALSSLLPSPPDIVVSGINAGLNCGTGFLLSSGTVGAAIEANLSGVPAVAVSQAFDTPTMNSYAANYSLESSTVERFGLHYVQALVPILVRIFDEGLAGLTKFKSTLNINMPFLLADRWSACLTDVDHTVYGSVFVPTETPEGQPEPRSFRHSVHKVVKEGIAHGDIATISRGDVSVTPLNPWMLGRREYAEEDSWTAYSRELSKALDLCSTK